MAILPRDTTLRVAIVNAVFCFVTTTLYLLARVEPSPMLSTFLTLTPLIMVILWLQKDARRTHLGRGDRMGRGSRVTPGRTVFHTALPGEARQEGW